MNTFERVRKIIANYLDKQEDRIVPETSLYDDLGTDSLGMVEIVMALEAEFCVDFADDINLTTVQEIVDYIEAHLRDQPDY